MILLDGDTAFMSSSIHSHKYWATFRTYSLPSSLHSITDALHMYWVILALWDYLSASVYTFVDPSPSRVTPEIWNQHWLWPGQGS